MYVFVNISGLHAAHTLYMQMYIVHTHIHTLFTFQNENVNRLCTSQRKVTDIRRPSRRTAMKVLVEKSFHFVDVLWASYIAQNRVDLQ